MKTKLDIMRMIEENKYMPLRIDFTGVQPFVFDALASKSERVALSGDEDTEVLASPFQKFSIEMAEGVLSSYDGKEVLAAQFQKFSTEIAKDVISSNKTIFQIVCIYCHELSVGRYHIMVQIVIDNVVKYMSFSPGDTIVPTEVSDYIMALVNSMLERLKTSRHGLINYSGKAKFKTAAGKKAIYKPTDVIYVGGGKGSSEPTHTKGGHNIRWQTTWPVMAHWRRLKNPESMGIGRTGRRDVKGWTWLNHYNKGDGAVKMKVHRVK